MEEDNKNFKRIKIVKCIGAVLLILACGCFLWAYTRVNNEGYSFNREHYENCMKGYNDNMAEAENSTGYFSSEYKSIADKYMDMAEDNEKAIKEYRNQAILFCICGVICLTMGVVFFKMRDFKTEPGKA